MPPAEPSRLSASRPRAPVCPVSAIPVSGQTGARGLLALNLDGSAGGITLHLLVFVDLFGDT